jgi:acyl-CoA thioester hydrolase
MEGFGLAVPVTVRFRDLDSLGHVNNAVYFTYCEVARNVYWRRLFGVRRLAEANFISVHADLDFRGQANGDHDVLVGIRASFIGNTSFGFQYRIEEAETGRLLADGGSVQVAFDYQKNEKVRVPENVRAKILEFEGPENVRAAP